MSQLKKNIAIVAGGDSSELVVSLKSAAGIKSFIDSNRYNVFIITIVGQTWQVELSDNTKSPIDKTISASLSTTKRLSSILLTLQFMEHQAKMVFYKGILI